jgi:hypothetical protein
MVTGASAPGNPNRTHWPRSVLVSISKMPKFSQAVPTQTARRIAAPEDVKACTMRPLSVGRGWKSLA